MAAPCATLIAAGSTCAISGTLRRGYGLRLRFRLRLAPAVNLPDKKSDRAAVRVIPESDGAAVHALRVAQY